MRDLRIATCGWLLSEVLRQLYAIDESYDVIGLVTKDANFILDLHLSCLDRRIPKLPSGTILLPLLRSIQL